jgi:hypothetical protein
MSFKSTNDFLYNKQRKDLLLGYYLNCKVGNKKFNGIRKNRLRLQN